MRDRSWDRVHRSYDRIRSRYFLHAEPPLLVPPPASQVTWYWLPAGSPYLGVTHFDPEDDVEAVALHPDTLRAGRFLETTLIHELIHMRHTKARCEGYDADGRRRRPNPAWLREEARLVELGASLL